MRSKVHHKRLLEQDPRTRDSKLFLSLEQLTAAVGTFPTASAYHHLALALSRPGSAKDMTSAIEHARAAVEADPNEIRHWHLLGLLLASIGDWKASKSVLELGIGISEADLLEDEPTANGASEGNGSANGLSIRDFVASVESAAEQPTNGVHVNGHTTSTIPQETIIAPELKDIPLSSTLLQSSGDKSPPSRQDRFEYALQARMTQLALTEFVEGAEAVGDKWLEVFHWFREKRPATLDDSESLSYGHMHKLLTSVCRAKVDR